MAKIALNELETYLWESANFLRSNIDASEYKQYIFPLLFYKRLSDVYDEETLKAKEKYGDDFELFDDDELHSFIVPDGVHWDEVRNTAENVGEAIVNAFRKIENANSEKLSGVFGDGAWTNKNKLPDYLLKDLMEHFSGLTLSLENCPEDELGNAYEYLIRKFADDSGHTAQEFYTNRTVVHLMTELLQPQPSESVYDPTCGTAGMLISCISYLKEKGKEWRNVQLYGQEITTLTSAIGKINCILHGVKDFEIVNGDTLTDPAFVEAGKLKTFNICLANPPYSISSWNRNAFESDLYGRNFLGIPPQGCADYAFIQHIFKSLDKTNGRCAILLPNGVLSRYSEIEIRKKLIDSDLIECIIGLGKGLFYNSPMESCILIAKTNKDNYRKNRIFFIDARKCLSTNGKNVYISEQDIKKIANVYENNLEIEGFSIFVKNEEIKNNESSMSLSKYLSNTISSSVHINLKQTYDEWLINSCSLKEYTSNVIDLLGEKNEKG